MALTVVNYTNKILEKGGIIVYDLSSKMQYFYNEYVVLPGDIQADLFKKKRLNISRLKEGLEIYNLENGRDYKVLSVITQGSIAMHTAIQNDKKDYDIDVAVIFDKDNIKDIGPQAIKNVVEFALKKTCSNFSTAPEAKTNCVRIEYAEGYHIDFAIYRRIKQQDGTYTYEHAGSRWRPRDPNAINNWFRNEVSEKGTELRQVVRLLKTFSKSRDDWKMPGGLIQSVLCDEVDFAHIEKLDEIFLYCLEKIKGRLNKSTDVMNPVDESISLLMKKADTTKMENLSSRLTQHLKKMDALYDKDCDEATAYAVWREFFQHDFWNLEAENLRENSNSQVNFSKDMYTSYNLNEEYIEDIVPVEEQFDVTISCTATRDGFRGHPLTYFLNKFHLVPQKLHLTFSAKCDIPGNYDVWWKVKNVGQEAKRRNYIRGEITRGNGKKSRIHKESSVFYGPHYIECYVIKNGVCIAIGHLDVPIDKNAF